MVSPEQVAETDQIRAVLRDALATPCECGGCLTDAELRGLLSLPDNELLEVLHS